MIHNLNNNQGHVMEHIINNNNASSYVTPDNKAYILGSFDDKEMRDFIGNLNSLIHKMPTMPIYKIGTKITSPYDTKDIKNPILDIYIDSNGGNSRMLFDIITLLSIAKARGAIIRTTVLSSAFSCGSLLAIHGTPGFRIMSTNAEHMVHYGRSVVSYTSESQKDSLLARNQHERDRMWRMYKTHTKIPAKILNELKTHSEGKYFTAEEYLQNGMCDWIISEYGQLNGRTK